MKRKIIAVGLTVVMLAAAAVSSTLAYLTDSDKATNVFTVGDVDIVFEEDAEVLDVNGDPIDGRVKSNSENGYTYENIVPTNTMKKDAIVKNEGSTDAYVRVAILMNNKNATLKALESYGGKITDVLLGWGNTYEYGFDAATKNSGITGIEFYDATKIDEATEIPGVSGDYFVKTYYFLLESEKTADIFDGFVSPKEFTAAENAMFDDLMVEFHIDAIQAEGFIADDDTAADAELQKAIKAYKALEEAHPLKLNTWDGTADTSWYDPANPQTEYIITTAEQLAGLAELVDGGNTFEGKTVKLANDIDLEAYDEKGEKISFDPIGYGYNTVFKGTFDGQGNTISNLYQNGWALGLDYSTEGGGLFASVVDATIKNLTIDSAEIVMECIDMGTLVGYSYGNCTYENISIKNSTIANYNRYTGGVVGEVNGTQVFKNVDIDDKSVVSALWGTYDASLGGIVGGKYGNCTLTFEDCDVACRLDAFNDACSNYQYYNYRLCGMLIGMTEEVTDGTASASYLTAENCTVTYGDWANYTYCEFEANGAGSYNDPGEWKFSRVQEGYATGGVDPNHTHDTDESHEELLVFDQLFGGDKGVKGGKTHPGVTVTYNNK